MNLFRSGSERGWLCPQTYHVDERTKLICKQQADGAFFYSDGAASERHLNHVLARATDLSVGSDELADGVQDWASAYHLSVQRADLLRPIAPLLGGNTLEIGAGCGAITRYIGEQGGRVIALEGSVTRAKLAQLRCRGLPNVHVMVDNFQTATFLQPFDLITLIGVLEYSPKYIQAQDPVGYVLERARDLLTPEGALVIAIENQMGLKYLSGAPEDHHDIPYVGVEDRYAGVAVTFGRAELERVLQAHGFASCEFFYPFGDYKMPVCILNQACADETDPFVIDLVRNSNRYQPPYMPVFSEEAAAAVGTRNGLMAHLANSFLVVARPQAGASLQDQTPRAWSYATRRAKPFAKETLFTKVDGDWRITRRRLYEDAAPAANAWVRLTLHDETTLKGRLMYQAFLEIVNTPGWNATHLAVWARPWLDLLLAARTQPERAATSTSLPGTCIDCVPQNIMLCHHGRAVAFDQEWSTTTPLQLGHVLLRGLGMTLARPRSVAQPAPGTPGRVLALVYQVMAQLGLPVSNAEFETFCAAEHAFQAGCGAHPPEPQETLFFSTTLEVRPVAGQKIQFGATALTAPQQARLLRPYFDNDYYLALNPDVKQAGCDPLMHFIAYGDAEGRDPCGWFSTSHYRKAHPDTMDVGWTGLLHYVLIGKHQGRVIVAPTPETRAAHGEGAMP